ncbi:MAG: hypothetical protein DVB31_01970 [Verrucomicrobia bacterium]|nr:MAG: hypothetical protein DVB31_01970 [Verrucomicrobiota bacterium]
MKLAHIPYENILAASMWQLEPTDQYERDLKWYLKKRPGELAAVLNNLQRYLNQLNAAPNSKAIMAGYLHPEQSGVIAVDQKGGGGNLQETRLYTFADDENKVLHLITIGNKDTQHDDVQQSSGFVKALKSGNA